MRNKDILDTLRSKWVKVYANKYGLLKLKGMSSALCCRFQNRKEYKLALPCTERGTKERMETKGCINNEFFRQQGQHHQHGYV